MKKALIFGGNGFIGAEVTKKLLQCGTFDITVVNRGKSWDWNTKDSVKPFVKCIKFDREKDINTCKELVDLLEQPPIDVIIDFSGYEHQYVKDTVNLFQDKAKLYIYISTDSVYEVCDKEHDRPTVETDAKRPKDDEKIKQYKRRDSYGHKKLKCEEVLERQSIPYVILRLADVIGVYDSTERWWQYQLWIEAAVKAELPVYASKELEQSKLSFVFVKDIANVVKYIVECKNVETINQCYNLACSEVLSLKELITMIARVACVKDVDVVYLDNDRPPQMYPSVEKGPISCDKAKDMLKFSPTTIEEAVTEIVHRYRHIEMTEEFCEEKESVLSELKDDLKGLYEKKSYCKLMAEIRTILNI